MEPTTPEAQQPVTANTTEAQQNTAPADTNATQANTPPAEQISHTEKLLAAVGYVSFLCLLPLLLKRESNYCQFHGKQALYFAVFWFIMAFLSFIPGLGILKLLELLSIVGCAYMAYSGSYFKIPILGDEAEKLQL